MNRYCELTLTVNVFLFTFQKGEWEDGRKERNWIGHNADRMQTLVAALTVRPQHRRFGWYVIIDSDFMSTFGNIVRAGVLHMIAQIHHKRLHSDISYIIKPVCVCVRNEGKQQSVSRTLNLCVLIKQNNNPPTHNNWLFSLIWSDSVHKHSGLNSTPDWSRIQENTDTVCMWEWENVPLSKLICTVL